MHTPQRTSALPFLPLPKAQSCRFPRRAKGDVARLWNRGRDLALGGWKGRNQAALTEMQMKHEADEKGETHVLP